MFQYRPEYKAHLYPEIDRCLTGEEKREALGYAREFGIELI
jgi:putative pyruvate formate lyase activating enzyme